MEYEGITMGERTMNLRPGPYGAPELDPAARRLLVEHLKRCPLCEAVSSVAAAECFVCGWFGEFQGDPEPIGASLDVLVARCPELVDAMLWEAEARAPWRARFERLRAFVGRTAARLFTFGTARRPLDLRA